MSFTSLEFLFVFLPIYVFLSSVFKKTEIKNIILIIFSLVFYSWGEPKNILLLLVMIIACYVLSNIISKNKKRVLLFVSIALLISPLIACKYFINQMPLGISFFTFQALSYLIDVYKGKSEFDKNPINLICYLSLFPTISSGPILRYEDIEESLHERKTDLSSIENGLCRFVIGLTKKIIIADNIAKIADAAFGMNVHVVPLNIAWFGAIAYMIQIYFDFSGYSDMAIGIGMISGFHFKENFDNPYVSSSISEFWRRWHISLGSWFRDYVYIPLGGNRVSTIKWIFNILVVWMLTGIWHGSSVNFVLWGLYFGVLLILEKKYFSDFLKKHSLLAHLYTLVMLLGGWIIFKEASIKDAVYYCFAMVDIRNLGSLKDLLSSGIIQNLGYLLIGIVSLFPCVRKTFKSFFEKRPLLFSLVCVVLLVVSVVFIENGSYTTFLYFKF